MFFAKVFNHIRKNIVCFMSQMLKALTIMLSLTIPFTNLNRHFANISLLRQTRYTGLHFYPHVEMDSFIKKIDYPRHNIVVVTKNDTSAYNYWDWMEPRYSLCLQPMRNFSRTYKLEQDQYIVITCPKHPHSRYIVRYRYPAVIYKDNELISQYGRCVDIILHYKNNTLINLLCIKNDWWFNTEVNVMLMEIHYSYVVVLIDNLIQSNGYCSNPFS